MDIIPLHYRILFIFSLIIAFLLTERRFSFDMKQKLKIFGGFFIIVYVGIILLFLILKSLINK